MDTLDDIERSKSLLADRHAQFDTTTKKIDTIRLEALRLQKDVLAAVKAKSGFYSTSKNRPQLNELSTTLLKFADNLEAASSLD